MPGNLSLNVEMGSPSRHRQHHNELVDGYPSIRHFSSVDNFIKPTTQSNKMHRKSPFIRSKQRQVTVTPDEYNALPTSIQMKCFSPTERLQIAQEAARQARKGSSPLSRPSIEAATRPRTGHRSEGERKDSSRPRSAHARCIVANLVNVRSIDIKITSSPTESISTRKGRVASTGAQSTGSQAIVDDEVEKTWLDADVASIHSVESSGTVDAIYKLYGQQRQDPAGVVNHVWPSRLQSRHVPSPSPSSRKRAIHLTPLRLPPPTLLPAIPSLPSPTTLKHMSKGTRSYSNTSAVSAPPFMTYDWRKPQVQSEKHDEAVQFGITPVPQEARAVSPFSNSDTFDPTHLDHDSEGDLVDDDDDDVSSAITPSIRSNSNDTSTFLYPSTESEYSLPITSKPPSSKASICSLSSEAGIRDLTTQIVLTKPDIRAPEDELYSHQRKQVSGVDVDTGAALNLQQIVVCEDHSGAHGAFAVRPDPPPKNGSFRKVWKNITRR